ncbi:ESX-1 secretion-associated protein [Amycolatopsis rhizosphaerae]|uniref:ESX-1 secretion-associated protein n=1 Tax=Amycolatopsis rhizosphaerae TaxID=2053003 RepID=A0A558C7H4_9PSEU|nr:type VII secretion target [Amycolatopsis rhizosphaerae]TVT44740.1 ESX-1 secretion-associated protein [Amycolatopsis rhizosphaerae]
MADLELSTDLTAHAQQLDAIGDGLQQAVDAANQVSMPTDAYGILCQPFRMLLDPVEQYGIDALQKAVEAMTAVSGNVREAAAAYDEYESGVADGLNKTAGGA